MDSPDLRESSDFPEFPERRDKTACLVSMEPPASLELRETPVFLVFLDFPDLREKLASPDNKDSTELLERLDIPEPRDFPEFLVFPESRVRTDSPVSPVCPESLDLTVLLVLLVCLDSRDKLDFPEPLEEMDFPVFLA